MSNEQKRHSTHLETNWHNIHGAGQLTLKLRRTAKEAVSTGNSKRVKRIIREEDESPGVLLIIDHKFHRDHWKSF